MDIKPRVSNSSPVATTAAAVADLALWFADTPRRPKFGQWGCKTWMIYLRWIMD